MTLLVDRNRIVTILRNLVGNALKFTDRGHVTVRCQVNDESVVFTVEDSGIGIPVEDQVPIFSLHHRGANAEARRRPGSGVGLYLVRQYAAQCGGTVSLHSVPQRGSTFTVTLPRAMAEARVA